MKQVLISNFYSDTKDDSGKLQHNTLINEDELFSVAEYAYQKEFSVMIKRLKEPTKDNAVAILYYSKKGFSQR